MCTLLTRIGPLVLAAATILLPACGGVPAKASPDDPAGNFSVVSPGIYRSGRPDQAGVERMAQMKIKTIIDLENDDQVVATEKGWAESVGIQFLSEPMSGTSTPNDAEVNDILAKLADPANRPVLVHCTKGQDRTGVIIALYRVFSEGWTPKGAHDEMEALGFNNLLLDLHHYYEHKTGWED